MNTAVLLESVTWRRPVALDFQGIGTSAEFVTDAGAASFALTNLPASWRLYDVTVASRAEIRGGGQRRELHAQPGRRCAPAATCWQTWRRCASPPLRRMRRRSSATSVQPTPSTSARRRFSDELEPLLALRRQQGFNRPLCRCAGHLRCLRLRPGLGRGHPQLPAPPERLAEHGAPDLGRAGRRCHLRSVRLRRDRQRYAGGGLDGRGRSLCRRRGDAVWRGGV